MNLEQFIPFKEKKFRPYQKETLMNLITEQKQYY